MKICFFLALLLWQAFSSSGLRAQETGNSCTVTYIANEGFLSVTDNQKVMFDALFGGIKGGWCDQPDDNLLKKITGGVIPFDNINIVLVSHKHIDHFNEQAAIEFMKQNRNSVLICPGQVNGILSANRDYLSVSDRIISVNCADTTLFSGGITVRAMKFRHGSYFETDSATGEKYDLHRDVQNYCYLVESNGFTLLHTGDCSTSESGRYEELGLKSAVIDVAFFSRTYLNKEGMHIINSLNINDIVFMHVEPGRAEYYKSFVKDYPHITIFDGMPGSKMFGKSESEKQ